MRAVKRARIFATLVIVAFAGAFLAWFVTITAERERYLTSRNFRLLAAIASQLDTSIDTQGRTFQTLLTAAPPADSSSDWYSDSLEYVPSLQALDRERQRPTRFNGPNTPAGRYKRTTLAVIDERNSWFRLSIERQTPPIAKREVYLGIGPLLSPVFGPKLRDGAFDTLLLASADGQVLHAEGTRSAELSHGRVDTLPAVRPFLQLPGQGPAPAAPAGFASVARTNGTVNVVVSGIEYKLFTQPCCSATLLQAGNERLVVVGLIEASAFRSKARQIPTTLVFVFSAAILLALAGWPFLRMRLLGERQRIRRMEVVQVIASGLFGIALLTVCCVDGFVYWHLNTVRDSQLENVARQIGTNVASELQDARHQLRTLTPAALQCARALQGDRPPQARREIFSPAVARQLAACGKTSPADDWPASSNTEAIGRQRYPRFKTMALIDKNGRQRVKWASRKWQPAPIDVATRAYFKDARDGRLWRLNHTDTTAVPSPCGAKTDNRYTLESIWSWTTAEPEAVIAIHTCDADFPVAALTIPMTSLIEPVIPAGVEFAVIAEDGAVLFHSDPQRNTHENLFEESDQNRRLRAAVAAHISEHVDVRYAGRSYQSYVQRLGSGTPWSVVTLSNNEPMWALHTEWLVLALVGLTIFLLFFSAVFAICFFTGHADWLWADIRQVHRYRALSLMVFGLLVLSLAALVTRENRTVATVSVALPLIGWAVSYLVVRRPPPGPAAAGAYPEWGLLAVLLFALTAIVPAAGFVMATYRLDVRADVKHVQLEFARGLARHEQRLSDDSDQYVNVPALSTQTLDGRYDVYQTTASAGVTPSASQLPSARFTPAVPASRRAREEPDIIDSIAEIVAEEYLPYYSERAVQIRELLLHQRADDDAWWWSNDTLTFTRPAGQPSIVVAAGVPALFEGFTGAAFPISGLLAVVAVVSLFALATIVVWFVEVHVCLHGVDEPLWAKNRWTSSSGQNLFVVCAPAERPSLSEGCFNLRVESEEWTLKDDALMARLLDRDRSAPVCPALFDDLEDLTDPPLAARKLAWLERLGADDTRTVIALSSDRPTLLDQILRAQVRRGVAGTKLLERWRTVLASFLVIDWRTTEERGPSPSWIARILREPPPLTLEGVRGVLDVRNDCIAREALTAEARADAFVRAVCDSIERRLQRRTVPAPLQVMPVAEPAAATLGLLPVQVLDEIADRTDTWYRRIWQSCSPDEQVVLSEIASEGFVNYKSRRIVRRLLGRRLIAKDPSFRLMNRTFRRFVLSPQCQADIRVIEGQSEPSPWDRFRIPFFSVVVALSLFFLVTQRELFNATIATLSTLAAAVPILTRVVALIGGKRLDAESKA